MKEHNRHGVNEKGEIQCIEVLVSTDSLVNNRHNLQWTLSVYSLEGHAIRKDVPLQGAEAFHFMVYDWNRTIRQLLETNQVPYSIVRLFSPDSLFPQSGAPSGDEEQTRLLEAIHDLEEWSGLKAAAPMCASGADGEESMLSILDEKDV